MAVKAFVSKNVKQRKREKRNPLVPNRFHPLHLGTRPVTSGPFSYARAFKHKTKTLPENLPTVLVAHYSIMCSLAWILNMKIIVVKGVLGGMWNGGLGTALLFVLKLNRILLLNNINKSFNIIHQ